MSAESGSLLGGLTEAGIVKKPECYSGFSSGSENLSVWNTRIQDYTQCRFIEIKTKTKELLENTYNKITDPIDKIRVYILLKKNDFKIKPPMLKSEEQRLLVLGEQIDKIMEKSFYAGATIPKEKSRAIIQHINSLKPGNTATFRRDRLEELLNSKVSDGKLKAAFAEIKTIMKILDKCPAVQTPFDSILDDDL